MATYAVIKNNVIINTIEWNGKDSFPLPEGCTSARLDKLPVGAVYPVASEAEASDIEKLQQDIEAIKVKVGA